MTTAPSWIDKLMHDPIALRSFFEYIDSQEAILLSQMRDLLAEGEENKARVLGGKSIAYKELRHQITMYQREEEQVNGIIQQGQ